MKQGIVQFLKFGIIGGVNSILTYVIYMVLFGKGISPFLCNAVAWVITVFLSYILNSFFVFQKKEGEKRNPIIDLMRVYASYALTGLLLNSFLLFLWIQVFNIPGLVATYLPIPQWLSQNINIPDSIPPLLNIAISTPINFLLNKFWAYRSGEKAKVGA